MWLQVISIQERLARMLATAETLLPKPQSLVLKIGYAQASVAALDAATAAQSVIDQHCLAARSLEQELRSYQDELNSKLHASRLLDKALLGLDKVQLDAPQRLWHDGKASSSRGIDAAPLRSTAQLLADRVSHLQESSKAHSASEHASAACLDQVLAACMRDEGWLQLLRGMLTQQHAHDLSTLGQPQASSAGVHERLQALSVVLLGPTAVAGKDSALEIDEGLLEAYAVHRKELLLGHAAAYAPRAAGGTAAATSVPCVGDTAAVARLVAAALAPVDCSLGGLLPSLERLYKQHASIQAHLRTSVVGVAAYIQPPFLRPSDLPYTFMPQHAAACRHWLEAEMLGITVPGQARVPASLLQLGPAGLSLNPASSQQQAGVASSVFDTATYPAAAAQLERLQALLVRVHGSAHATQQQAAPHTHASTCASTWALQRPRLQVQLALLWLGFSNVAVHSTNWEGLQLCDAFAPGFATKARASLAALEAQLSQADQNAQACRESLQESERQLRQQENVLGYACRGVGFSVEAHIKTARAELEAAKTRHELAKAELERALEQAQASTMNTLYVGSLSRALSVLQCTICCV